MQALGIRCRHQTHSILQPQRHLTLSTCCSARHAADTSSAAAVRERSETQAVSSSQHHKQYSRRGALATVLLLGTALPCRASVSSDLVEGTQNWLSIGRESFGLWVQKVVDDIANGDETGITDLDSLDGIKSKRRFGSISVPGLSSFSFIHGALVGGAVILLLAADKLTPSQQQQMQQPGAQQHPTLNPEVEAALKQLLASPEVKAQFHDPAVHAALQEVRVDPRAIAKYRDDPVVMQAFSRLLEIEDILERL